MPRVKKPEFKTFSIRVTKDQWQALEQLAEKKNAYMSPMCRDILLKSAKRNGIEVV